MKVLIAEDDRGAALILCRSLEKHGHQVTVAADGFEAWTALQREHFPLVISDWLMPVMDGPVLCRLIREHIWPSYVYIILLTSLSAKHDRLEGLRSGADDFVEKPLGRDELSVKLEIAQRILGIQDELLRRAQEVGKLNEDLLSQNMRVRALNAELEQFASIACHDLQEPLRKMQMFSSRLISQGRDSMGQREMATATSINQAAMRMQSLVRELFELTQIDRTERTFVDVDLGKVAAEAVVDLETMFEETGGRIEIGDLPTVCGDPVQLRQLLQNLVSNALKFHLPGETPSITIRNNYRPGAAIEITDNGIGFDEQYLTKIFKPFQRLHSRTEYEGTGIGLAICQKIVDRHGGTITARSALGCGATFELDFHSDRKK